MRILGIDPGTTESAWVIYDTEAKDLIDFAIQDNQEVREAVDLLCYELIVIEMIGSYGMPVGAEVFETCIWIGRFIEACGLPWHLLKRGDIKLQLCNSRRAKDANVRQALLDRFPATGGGKTPQVGTKKQPGPLYGMKSHLWSALAVAVAWWEVNGDSKEE